MAIETASSTASPDDGCSGPPPATPRIGPFRVIRQLGAGSMATVYLGEAVEALPYVRAGEPVALKILRADDVRRSAHCRARFRQEAEIGVRIEHPSVVRTFACEVIEIDGRAHDFLVLEYVEGR